MRHPQILVYERDGRLARLLSETAEVNRWALHEPRQVENCLNLLREGGPSVLVLRVGSKVESELELLEPPTISGRMQRSSRLVTWKTIRWPSCFGIWAPISFCSRRSPVNCYRRLSLIG